MARVQLPDDIDQVISGGEVAVNGTARFLDTDSGLPVTIYTGRVNGTSTATGVATVTSGRAVGWVDSGVTLQYYVTPSGSAEQGPFYREAASASAERGRARSITDAVGIYTGAAVGATNNAAVIQAHMDAIVAAGGGVLTAPEGDFAMEAGLNPPYTVPFLFKGAGQSTILRWSTDLGAGNYAVKWNWTGTPSVATINNMYPCLEGLRLIGPDGSADVTSGQVGVASAAMHGVDLFVKAELNHCRVEGFHDGVSIYGNHQRIINTVIRACYDGLAWRTSPDLDPMSGNFFGDQYLDNVDITGHRHAAIRVDTTNAAMATVQAIRCQIGYSPYCFYRPAGTPNANFMSRCTFTDCNFESWGNAFIKTVPMDASFDTIKDCVFTGGNVKGGTLGTAPSIAFNENYYIAADGRNFAVEVGKVENTLFDGCPVVHSPGSTGNIRTKTWKGSHIRRAGELVDNITTYGRPVFSIASGGSGAVPWDSQIEARGVIYRIGQPFATLAVGDLVQLVINTTGQVTLASGTGIEVGIAQEAGASGGENRVLFATSGVVTAKTAAADGAITAGTFIKRDGANNGKVLNGLNTDGGRLIGFATAASASGLLQVKLRGLE